MPLIETLNYLCFTIKYLTKIDITPEDFRIISKNDQNNAGSSLVVASVEKFQRILKNFGYQNKKNSNSGSNLLIALSFLIFKYNVIYERII